jgi:hypothetical protein
MAITSDGTPTFFQLTQEQYDTAYEQVVTAQQAWDSMITEFAAENVAMGIIQEGKTTLVGAALNQVNMYGQQGALAQAYFQLGLVVLTPAMAPYLTQDRIKWLMNKVIQSLGTL